MLNIYLSDNKIQVISGTAGSTIKVKELYYTIAESNLADIAVKLLDKVGCLPKSTVNVIVDSPQVMIKQEQLPCVQERDLRKIIEDKGVQSGEPVDNTVDEVMEVIRKHEAKRIKTVARTTVIPTFFMAQLEKIVKARQLNLNKIFTAQECVAEFMKKFAGSYFGGSVLLVQYKRYFATIAIFKDGIEIHSESVTFADNDQDKVFKRLTELSHRGIMYASENHKMYIEKVYVVGDIDNFEIQSDNLSAEIGVDIELLPIIKEVKGISQAELNEFFSSVGSLLLSK